MGALVYKYLDLAKGERKVIDFLERVFIGGEKERSCYRLPSRSG